MTTTTARAAGTQNPDFAERLRAWLPRLVLAPSFALVLVFVYGFNLWTIFLSFTNSKAFATTKLVGLANYEKLWNWTGSVAAPRPTATRLNGGG